MRVFESRRDAGYLDVLNQRLSIEGPDGLLARAVEIAKPREIDGKTFTRCCRIDFTGIAATNLFDAGGNFVPTSVADRLEDLFERAHVLNDAGIFIKLRILLVYPYSAYALSRIQAECSSNRASMSDPVFLRNLQLVESVDEHTFGRSAFVNSQCAMLDQLQEWVDKHSWTRTSVNRAMVRFAPVSPNLCVLFVNDTIFADAYLLAKENRQSHRCASLAPLVQVERRSNPKTFDAFDDHFRYLWDLDLTLFCEDATHYSRGKPKSLGRIKPPATVTFENKASIIGEKTEIPDEAMQIWKFRASRLLDRFCLEPAPTPGSEGLFITCSWQKGDDERSVPNSQARELSVMLETDLGRERGEPLVSVFIMEAAVSDFLTRQLYARLEESTLGLILLTSDIEDKDGNFYSRPNVYHELGFLWKQLGPGRVILVCEKGVTIPTNIRDIVQIEFPKDKMVLSYREIMKWLSKVCGFNRKTARDLLQAHKSRLDDLILNGRIQQPEGNKAIERILQDMAKLEDEGALVEGAYRTQI